MEIKGTLVAFIFIPMCGPIRKRALATLGLFKVIKLYRKISAVYVWQWQSQTYTNGEISMFTLSRCPDRSHVSPFV